MPFRNGEKSLLEGIDVWRGVERQGTSLRGMLPRDAHLAIARTLRTTRLGCPLLEIKHPAFVGDEDIQSSVAVHIMHLELGAHAAVVVDEMLGPAGLASLSGQGEPGQLRRLVLARVASIVRVEPLAGDQVGRASCRERV